MIMVKTTLIIVAIGLCLMIFILPLFCVFLAIFDGRHQSRTSWSLTFCYHLIPGEANWRIVMRHIMTFLMLLWGSLGPKFVTRIRIDIYIEMRKRNKTAVPQSPNFNYHLKPLNNTSSHRLSLLPPRACGTTQKLRFLLFIIHLVSM